MFVGGVLCTLSAWVIGFPSLLARVRAGAEAAASPRLAFMVQQIHEEVNKGCTKKETRAARPPVPRSVMRRRCRLSLIAEVEAWATANDVPAPKPSAGL